MTVRANSHSVPGPPGGECGPWNPGLDSHLPRELLPLSTMFWPANVLTSIEKAEELHDLTGLPIHGLVAFRPERLLLHELLIRVTADLSVPSGSRVEDLGINFRQITNAILANHLASRMGEVTVTYDALRRQLSRVIEAELAARLFASDTGAGPKIPERRKGFSGLFRGASTVDALLPVDPWGHAQPEDALSAWQARARSSDDALHKAAYRSLVKVVSSLLGRHGRVWGTPSLSRRWRRTSPATSTAAKKSDALSSPIFSRRHAAKAFVAAGAGAAGHHEHQRGISGRQEHDAPGAEGAGGEDRRELE